MADIDLILEDEVEAHALQLLTSSSDDSRGACPLGAYRPVEFKQTVGEPPEFSPFAVTRG